METKSIADLKSASDLCKKFEDLKSARQRRERDWRLNMSFYKGNQYVFYNRVTRRIESLAVDDADKPRHRVRITDNRITRGVQGYVSKLTKTKPVMFATPESGDDNALKAAQVSESLLEMWWNEFSLREKLLEALTWSTLCGNGYLKATWDPYANKPMEFMVGPDGQPITDESLKTIFAAELEQAGVDIQQVMKTVYMGDISVETLSPFDVFLDDSARTFGEAKYAICRHAMSPAEVKAKFKVDVEPNAVTDNMSSAFAGFGEYEDETSQNKNLTFVYFGYFVPCPALPKGRYVVWTDSSKKMSDGAKGGELLLDTEWPYPFHKLPLIKIPCITVPGDPYDSSLVEHAIPLQKEYNRTRSQIVEHKNMTVKPQWKTPVGSLRQKLTNEPGAVWEYNPQQGLGPEPVQITGIPSYVSEHLESIRRALDEAFYDTPVMSGNLPPNLESAQAIDLLQEMATDKFAPIIGAMEDSIADLGQIMLSLAQKYYVEPRVLKITGSGSKFKVKQFTKADISGGITVRVEAGSGLPRTRAARQARIDSWVEKGMIPADRAWKYFEAADMKAVGQQFMADEEMAQREHERMLEGRPVNEMAVQQAIQQVQQSQGVNPQTGQPFQSPDEIQQFITEAGLQPTQFENVREHVDVHAMFLKSVEFESMPPEKKQAFITHYMLSIQKMQAIPQPPKEIEAPRVSLQLKGTVGASGAAAMLNKAGVTDITPEIMSEPPLETVVFDNLDKANPGEPGANAGNDPYAMATMKQAQAEQDMMNKELANEQALRHKEDQHQASMRQAKDAQTGKK